MSVTHEQFIHAVRELVIGRLNSPGMKELLMRAKLVYGYGHSRARRGVTCYQQWHKDGQDGELVEICASGEENEIQLAGTTIHELAHVIAGHGAKHGPEWKEMCHLLGLRKATAKSTDYTDPEVWEEDVLAAIHELEPPQDGRPTTGGLNMRTGKGGCSTGQKKQTARLRLWVCGCQPKPVRLRVASDDLLVMCLKCGAPFKQPEETEGGAEQ